MAFGGKYVLFRGVIGVHCLELGGVRSQRFKKGGKQCDLINSNNSLTEYSSKAVSS